MISACGNSSMSLVINKEEEEREGEKEKAAVHFSRMIGCSVNFIPN